MIELTPIKKDNALKSDEKTVANAIAAIRGESAAKNGTTKKSQEEI